MDEEFMNTLRNLGTKWYQCPKGHAYTIGECGLAMIESRCPECGEKIGGSDHKLLKTNRLVDFDLDVKNNIDITPVKVINNKNNKKGKNIIKNKDNSEKINNKEIKDNDEMKEKEEKEEKKEIKEEEEKKEEEKKEEKEEKKEKEQNTANKTKK